MESVKANIWSKVYTLIVIMIPILYPYTSFVRFILLPELLLILLLPFLLLQHFRTNERLNIYKYKSLLFFLAIINFATIVAAAFNPNFLLTDYLKAILRFSFYVGVVFFLTEKYFILQLATKWHLRLANVSAVYLLIQFSSYKLFEKILPWYFRLLNVHSLTYTDIDFTLVYSRYYRPSSFFLEPAHLVYYLVPALLYLLFYCYTDSNNRLPVVLNATLLTLAMIVSTSGSGILFSFVFWCLWLFSNMKDKKSISKILKFIFGISLMLTASYFVLNTEYVQQSIGRLYDAGNYLTSVNVRILRGFYVYGQIPFLQKILGVGYGNYAHYIQDNSIITAFDLRGDGSWVNTLANILVTTGITGLLAFIRLFFDLFVNTNKFHKLMVLYLFMLTIFSSQFTAMSIIFYLSLIYSGYCKYNLKRRSAVIDLMYH